VQRAGASPRAPQADAEGEQMEPGQCQTQKHGRGWRQVMCQPNPVA
jgi:hypothetical protein